MTSPVPMEPRPDVAGPAKEAGAALLRLELTLATAESCTGGMVAAALTANPGSSGFFLGGIVAYADAVKVDVLGVSETVLRAHGAVSAETAIAMAEGVRALLGADMAVSVTGVAGPGGGTPAKPVGLVYVGYSAANGASAQPHHFAGERDDIRRHAAAAALAAVLAGARGSAADMPRVAGEGRPSPPEPAAKPVIPTVRAAFSGAGDILPMTFRWRGREHAVAQVGGERRTAQGRIFTVMTPEARMFELGLDPGTLTWTVAPVGPVPM